MNVSISSRTEAAANGRTTAAAALARTILGLALSVIAGVAANLAFPPYGAWPLILVAFAPMAVAQHRVLPRSLGPLAPGVAIAIYYAGQLSAGLADGDVSWLIQLWPIYVGAFVSALCWLGRGFHETTGYRWIAIAFPLAWTGLDAARMLSGVDVLAGTWGNPAYALYQQARWLQPLSVFGIFGLQFLLLAVNFAIAGLVISWLDRRTARSNLKWSMASGVMCLSLAAVWCGASLVMFGERPASLRVAAIMSNTRIQTKADFESLLAATRSAGRQGANIVVWHEGALRFDPRVERTGELNALARDSSAYVAVGYRVTDPDGLARNEALVFAPDGTVFGPYGKTHPGRFAGDLSDTGGEFKVYETTVGRIATIICYDLDFTDTAREMARRGAQFIAVPSNDVPAIAARHYTHLVFRAIENRLPMAKADSFFDTAIIDPFGRILALEVNLLSREEAAARDSAIDVPPSTILADVPRGWTQTFYTRFGDWIGWLAAIGALALFGAGAIATSRLKRPS